MRAFGLYIFPALACLILIFTVSWISSFSPSAKALQSKFLDIAEPVIKITERPIVAMIDYVHAMSLYNENVDAFEQLREENEQLKHWMQVAQMMQAENNALKKLVNIQDEEALSFTSGKIIVDNSSSYAQTVLVRLSAGHNVQKGQAVIVDKGLVGRVVETADEYARILLLTDMNARVPVIVEETGDKAILSGTNDSAPVLEHLSPYNTVQAGQKVITSGHGGALPYGIEVGETVLNDKGEVEVQLFASHSNTSFVKIVDYGLKSGLAGGSYAAMSGLSNVY